MSIEFNPYDTLGISRRASSGDVNRAFERLVRRLHPDVNQSGAAQAQHERIVEAYNFLTNIQLRSEYDRNKRGELPAKDYFSLNTLPSKRAITPIHEPQVFYMLADIAAPVHAAQEASDQIAHLNLTLVLDQSNSMNKERRLDRVKLAAQTIVDTLSENDFISIVTFNNKANVLLPATSVDDKARLRSRISMMQASGGTEIFQGLQLGVAQNEVYMSNEHVNHIILLTDGHTFGDMDECLELARVVSKKGVGISAMGLGVDWNDSFLDELAFTTGGSSTFIDSVDRVTHFMNNQVRNLTMSYAERIKLSIAPDPDVSLEMAFMLTPSPQPMDITGDVISLPNLQAKRSTTLLLQFLLPDDLTDGFRSIARMVAVGNILASGGKPHTSINDITMEINSNPTPEQQKPPTAILEALSKLTLYQLQEKAKSALENGNVDEATRSLNALATRLYEHGEDALASQVAHEANTIAFTNQLSKQGSKTIKYQTRALVGGVDVQASLTNLLTSQLDTISDKMNQSISDGK